MPAPRSQGRQGSWLLKDTETLSTTVNSIPDWQTVPSSRPGHNTMRPCSSQSGARLLPWPSRVPPPLDLPQRQWQQRQSSHPHHSTASTGAQGLWALRLAGPRNAVKVSIRQQTRSASSRAHQMAAAGRQHKAGQQAQSRGQGKCQQAEQRPQHQARQTNGGSSAPSAAEGRSLERTTAVPGGSGAGRQRQGKQEGQGRGWSKRPDGSTTAGTGGCRRLGLSCKASSHKNCPTQRLHWACSGFRTLT